MHWLAELWLGVGILFIYLFSVILGILPSFGRGEVIHFGFFSWTIRGIYFVKASIGWKKYLFMVRRSICICNMFSGLA